VQGAVNLTNGTVTVNGAAAVLRSTPEGGCFFIATNQAVASGTNVYTALHTDPFGRVATGRVSVVAQNRGYGYDANGNMTNDSQFAYVWDDADRLVELRSLATGLKVMSRRYDARGRRLERVEYAGGVGTTNRYVYDGWNVQSVLSGSNTVLETYVHGPDLSGTLQGAGGIGGILSVTIASNAAVYHQCSAVEPQVCIEHQRVTTWNRADFRPCRLFSGWKRASKQRGASSGRTTGLFRASTGYDLE
jgi:hypothetical protein